MIAAAREAIPRGRPFIVGTGRESTRAAVAATRRAAELGADAVLVRTPGFFKSQMTDRRLRPALHGGGRRVAGAGAALQLHRGDRRQPAGRRGGAAGHASEHRRHEGIGRRRRADRRSRREHAGVVSACSPGRRRRSTRRCASAPPAAFSRSAACCPTRACASSTLTRAGAPRRGARPAAASWCRSRGCSAGYGVAGLKAALRSVGLDVGVPRPPLAPVPDDGLAALRDRRWPLSGSHRMSAAARHRRASCSAPARA